MADLRQCSREFLVEFIELYKSFPSLWKVKSKEYSDRDKKNQAYESLVDKYKAVDSDANRETIKKKINSMRSVYRKELLKVNKSLRSGVGAEDVYKPTLWYFDLLSFLSDQETPRVSKSTLDDESDSCSDADGNKSEDGNLPNITADQSAPATPVTPASPTSTGRRPSSSSSRSQPSSRKRKTSYEEDSHDVMKLVGDKLNSLKQDDSFDVFGKHIANKLRSLNKEQNMFAQKLINDVLYEAEMETLNKHFKVVNLGEPQYMYNNYGAGSYNQQTQWQPPQTVHQQYPNVPSHVTAHQQYPNVPSQVVAQPRNFPLGVPHLQDISGNTNRASEPTIVDYLNNFSENVGT